MQRLAQRNKWDGVERNYQAILALDISVDAKVYHLGALAARDLGDSLSFYRREQSTLQNNPDDDVKNEVKGNITYIERSYGFVGMTLPPGSFYSLVPSEMPMAPDQRASIASADARLKTQSFKGLLPVANISYTLVPNGATPSTQEQPSYTFQSIAEKGNEKYQKIKIGKTGGEKEAVVTNKNKIWGVELGSMVGHRTTSPTYGPDYTMRGTDSSFFAGLHANIPLAPNFVLRPGVRAIYGVTTQRADENIPYEFADSYLQGSLRLHGFYKTRPMTMEMPTLLLVPPHTMTHPATVLEQSAFF